MFALADSGRAEDAGADVALAGEGDGGSGGGRHEQDDGQERQGL